MKCFALDVLRSLVLLSDLGSLGRAAEAQSRTQSALSVQLSRLEEQTGLLLLEKRGRRLAFTPDGHRLLAQARKLLDLNDATFRMLEGGAETPKLALGVPQDVAETWFPRVLAGFSKAFPHAELTVKVDRGTALAEAFKAGGLDLIMFWGRNDAVIGARRIGRFAMTWIGPARLGRLPSPLPLIVMDGSCVMRRAGEAALRRAGIPYRVAFTSSSPSGIWSAVSAGLGVTVRTTMGLPAEVQALARQHRLPELPCIDLHVKRCRTRAAPLLDLEERLIAEVATIAAQI